MVDGLVVARESDLAAMLRMINEKDYRFWPEAVEPDTSFQSTALPLSYLADFPI